MKLWIPFAVSAGSLLTIASFVGAGWDEARQILTDKAADLETLAQALLEYETIDTAQIDDIMEGARADASNRWSLTPFHYEPRYYGHFLQALQEQVAVAAEAGPSGIVAEVHSG